MFNINSGGDVYRGRVLLDNAPEGLSDGERAAYDAWAQADGAARTSCFRFYFQSGKLHLEVEFTGDENAAEVWAAVDTFARTYGDFTDDDMSSPEEHQRTIGVWKVMAADATPEQLKAAVQGWRDAIQANPLLDAALMEVY